MTAPPPPLSDLLHRTAKELHRCRDFVVRLEDAVHALIDHGGTGLPAGPLTDLQAIDLLDQRLGDLAHWLEMLGGASGPARPGQPVAALARGLRLAEMRRALAGEDSDAPAAAGATEVF